MTDEIIRIKRKAHRNELLLSSSIGSLSALFGYSMVFKGYSYSTLTPEENLSFGILLLIGGIISLALFARSAWVHVNAPDKLPLPLCEKLKVRINDLESRNEDLELRIKDLELKMAMLEHDDQGKPY